METRIARISATHPGGNSGKGALKYRVQLPAPWIHELGISAEEREMKLTLQDEQIILEKLKKE